MTTFDAKEFILRAKHSINMNQLDQAEFFLDLALECANPPEMARPVELLLTPATPSSTLKEDGLAGTLEIHAAVCKCLRTKNIGFAFSYVFMAHYLVSLDNLKLDRTIIKNDNRERWRDQLSKSLEKLQFYRFIGKGDKRGHYVLIAYP
jgi:hypothetical protein